MDESELIDSMCAMIGDPDYPCLGARSVFRRERAVFHVYEELGTSSTARRLLPDLARFAEEVDQETGLASFVALFRGPEVHDERDFERLLWAQLRQLHAEDEQPWAPEVSADPQDPHFAFSAAGTAYFIVGLHPMASRYARRSAVPTLVFNLHEQFEELRSTGIFPRMRDRIRSRDARLQGQVNPMVSDHGQSSEARQYSGREVALDWRAPFHPEPQGRRAEPEQRGCPRGVTLR
jgi:FPC/CPF motif-containing protein YcgG